jgi:hypothetical protein
VFVGAALSIPLRIQVPAPLHVLFSGFLELTGSGERPLKFAAIQNSKKRGRVRHKCRIYHAPDIGLAALHFAVDKALVVEIQLRRPDLLFFHAAVLTKNNRAVVLLAHSGGGKSTTAFAALQNGFGVASDELAPIDPTTMVVWPFPRALCFKSRPSTLSIGHSLRLRRIGSRWYYPLSGGLKSHQRGKPITLDALVMLKRNQVSDAILSEVSPGQALACAYSYCLNPMAHPNGGLIAIRALTTKVPIFVLESGSVFATLDRLEELLRRPR